jgi:hypothetical protein
VIEIGVVILLFGALVGGPALVAVAPWEITFGAGLALVGLGMAVGVPAGAYYHYLLWRALRPGRLWWLHPTKLHQRLSGTDRAAVLRWFKVGAVMWGVAVLGCLVTAVGALRSR